MNIILLTVHSKSRKNNKSFSLIFKTSFTLDLVDQLNPWFKCPPYSTEVFLVW